MPLVRLLYSSTATAPIRLPLIKDIMARSVARNEQDGLTGLLVCAGDRFMQVLEGPELAVQRTYLRIAQDPRHADIRLLHSGSIASREFARWSMRGLRLERLAPALRARLRREGLDPQAGLAVDDAEAVYRLLRAVYAHQEDTRAAIAPEGAPAWSLSRSA